MGIGRSRFYISCFFKGVWVVADLVLLFERDLFKILVLLLIGTMTRDGIVTNLTWVGFALLT